MVWNYLKILIFTTFANISECNLFDLKLICDAVKLFDIRV